MNQTLFEALLILGGSLLGVTIYILGLLMGLRIGYMGSKGLDPSRVGPSLGNDAPAEDTPDEDSGTGVSYGYSL
jgi:hypothetical protein